MWVRAFYSIVAIVSLLSLPSAPAHGWGREGHQVIAIIAENHLSPAAAARVAGLLQVDGNLSLADIANWADDYRKERSETASWHFVDIPLEEERYNTKRDCPGNNCVVAKIYEMANYLRDPKTPLDGQVLALKYLVHFVGDIHQPLHCADHNDGGGNRVRVMVGEGRQPSLSLHSVWDTEMVSIAGPDGAKDLAARLDAEITDDEVQSWLSKSKPEDWANDTHALAVSTAYGNLPQARVAGVLRLEQSYFDAAEPIAMRQLEAAGIRLASILNAVFKK